MTFDTNEELFMKEELTEDLYSIRAALEPAFSYDTAYKYKMGWTPSAGHCGAVAVIVNTILGGAYCSATVDGESHWFNRLSDGNQLYDVDLTGDQFGKPPVQMADVGRLYAGTRIRDFFGSVSPDTMARALRLAQRAKLSIAVEGIERDILLLIGR